MQAEAPKQLSAQQGLPPPQQLQRQAQQEPPSPQHRQQQRWEQQGQALPGQAADWLLREHRRVLLCSSPFAAPAQQQQRQHEPSSVGWLLDLPTPFGEPCLQQGLTGLSLPSLSSLPSLHSLVPLGSLPTAGGAASPSSPATAKGWAAHGQLNRSGTPTSGLQRSCGEEGAGGSCPGYSQPLLHGDERAGACACDEPPPCKRVRGCGQCLAGRLCVAAAQAACHACKLYPSH